MREINVLIMAAFIAALAVTKSANAEAEYQIAATYPGFIYTSGANGNNILSTSGAIAYSLDDVPSGAGVLQNSQATFFNTSGTGFSSYISPDGTVVGGVLYQNVATSSSAFVVKNGTVTVLPVPNEGYWTGGEVSGVTSNGYVTGDYFVPNSQTVAAVWQNGSLVNNFGSQGGYSWISGVTNSNVLGGAIYPSGQSQPLAVTWSSPTATSYTDIGAGANSGITVVEPNGLMMGSSTKGAFTYQVGGSLNLIGSPTGVDPATFFPESMNANGLVTGYVYPPDGDSDPLAYIGDNGQYSLLDTLVDNPNNYEFQFAWTDNTGTIYADYVDPAGSGYTDLAILEPVAVPEPTGFALASLVTLVLLLRRRRVHLV
jgi:hypothetical protein